jgi:hypothetical protein
VLTHGIAIKAPTYLHQTIRNRFYSVHPVNYTTTKKKKNYNITHDSYFLLNITKKLIIENILYSWYNHTSYVIEKHIYFDAYKLMTMQNFNPIQIPIAIEFINKHYNIILMFITVHCKYYEILNFKFIQ